MRKTFKISHNIEITDETLHQGQYYWWCTGTSRPFKPSREGWRNANQSISESSEVRLIRMTRRPWPHHCCLFPDLNGAAECFHSTSAAQSSNGQSFPIYKCTWEQQILVTVWLHFKHQYLHDNIVYPNTFTIRYNCHSPILHRVSFPPWDTEKKQKLDESVSQKAPEFGIKWLLLFDLLVCKANCIIHAIRTYCYM